MGIIAHVTEMPETVSNPGVFILCGIAAGLIATSLLRLLAEYIHKRDDNGSGRH